MLLFADSGSTKCDWVLFENKDKEPIKITTKGLNPSIISQDAIKKIISKNEILSFYSDKIKSIYFFGAGCNTPNTINLMEGMLLSIFENSIIVVKGDTMAAIWATTNKPAVVCILGTGSNCCFYDGENTHFKVPAMGYLLMDEGSGNYFGKELLKAYFYNQMTLELRFLFESEFSLDKNEVIENLYQSKTPNKYLAEFAKFLVANKEHELIDKIIKEGISKFIDNHILQFKEELETVPLYFVGSVAYYLQDYIMSALKEKGLKASRFVKKPIDNVILKIMDGNFLI